MVVSTTVAEIFSAQRAHGIANVLAIGTSVPENCYYQADYPDFYFRVTKSEHMTDLKEKFKRICDKSMVKKRYMHLTEDILKENPNMCKFMAPSLDARLKMVTTQVPKLGKEAAINAIEEWGQPKSKITHLVVCTTASVRAPGADNDIRKLLGLEPSVKRYMLYHQGCNAGGAVLRLAKDLAENNAGARVLIVCSETSLITFRGPSDTHVDSLVGHALFSDGAGAMIVGSDPNATNLVAEHPIFQIVSASQTVLPDSENHIGGHTREVGLMVNLSKEVASLVSKNIEKSLDKAFTPIGISDWNSLFWIAHPGGPAILDQVEQKLGLKEDKLRASRYVLREYGNMLSTSVTFILDEMRKRSKKEGMKTTGEGLEWGVLFGFGPGLTIDTVVLHSVPTAV
ncbi:hypothetical protein MKW94_015657 [Papaver nudicaule]|uniref:Chalcone synthase n=1 Tax=Papaver nudicaule TaxID=74823 RepID=A0AA41W3D8_PAPNU|nr:hypothetical protein [Papaver nudicaule]